MYEIWARLRGKEREGFHQVSIVTTTIDIAKEHIKTDIEAMGFIKQTAFVTHQGWEPVPGWDGVLYRYGDTSEMTEQRRSVAMAARRLYCAQTADKKNQRSTTRNRDIEMDL
jgi:hypothetical protein